MMTVFGFCQMYAALATIQIILTALKSDLEQVVLIMECYNINRNCLVEQGDKWTIASGVLSVSARKFYLKAKVAHEDLF